MKAISAILYFLWGSFLATFSVFQPLTPLALFTVVLWLGVSVCLTMTGMSVLAALLWALLIVFILLWICSMALMWKEKLQH